MWEHRNEIKHNNTTPRERDELQNLRKEVEEQFVLGELGLPSTDHYLLEDKDKVFTYDLAHTKRWLKCITLARTEKLQLEARMRDRYRFARRIMKNWLLTANHPSKIRF
jgi:hypothetical protein